jgi:hypothetical protein
MLENILGTIHRNCQHRVHNTKKKKQKHKTIFAGHHYTQTNTNFINKTWAIAQTTGGKEEHRFYSEIVTDITTRTKDVKKT